MFIMLFCAFYCFCIFFFKQKTAYELRISDWSSDVCSSDLLRHVGDIDGLESGVRADHRHHRGKADDFGESVEELVLRSEDDRRAEIGRASCRERVCQTCRSRWSPYH